MSEENKPRLPVITVISRANAKGSIDKASIILMDGKVISGLANFKIEMDGEDPSGIPTVNLKIKAFVQVVQEPSDEQPPK